jgi:hypothetical protein
MSKFMNRDRTLSRHKVGSLIILFLSMFDRTSNNFTWLEIIINSHLHRAYIFPCGGWEHHQHKLYSQKVCLLD